jgi:hypothetical protein
MNGFLCCFFEIAIDSDCLMGGVCKVSHVGILKDDFFMEIVEFLMNFQCFRVFNIKH